MTSLLSSLLGHVKPLETLRQCFGLGRAYDRDSQETFATQVWVYFCGDESGVSSGVRGQ